MDADQYQQAEQLFLQILARHEQRQDISKSQIGQTNINTHQLVLQTLNHSSPPKGRETFLRYAFSYISSHRNSRDVVYPIPSEHDLLQALSNFQSFEAMAPDDQSRILTRVTSLGQHFLFIFVHPMMSRSETPSVSKDTPSRSCTLRDLCVRRDGYMCAVTKCFDMKEAASRMENNANADAPLLDDDNRPIVDIDLLEIAHIIPHSLGWEGTDEPSQPKINALSILNMFRPGAMQNYAGRSIDRPANGIILSASARKLFSTLNIYFEPQDNQSHSYRVRHIYEDKLPMKRYPTTVTLRNASGIEMPDPELFAIHRACAMISCASGAAKALDQLFHDMDDGAVEADGSTAIGYMVSHKLLFGPGRDHSSPRDSDAENSHQSAQSKSNEIRSCA